MSAEALELLQIGNIISYIFLGLLSIVFLYGFIYIIVMSLIWDKIDKNQKTETRLRREYLNNKPEISVESEEEHERSLNEIRKMQDELQEKIDENDKKREKLDKAYSLTEKVSGVLARIALPILAILFLFMLLIETEVGGSISDIRQIENTSTKGINLTAYYVIDYDASDQQTITVIVRNDSKKTLESADITESRTNSSETINFLEPGQEKIVSIDIYTDGDDEYSFSVDDIKFIE